MMLVFWHQTLLQTHVLKSEKCQKTQCSAVQKEVSVFLPFDAHTARRLAMLQNHKLHSLSVHYSGSCCKVHPRLCFNAATFWKIGTDKE